MNFAEALSFTFEDSDWLKKMAIGGALNFAGWFMGLFFITGIFTLGYFVLIISNVYKNNKPELPGWNEISAIFVDGLVGGIVMLLYFLMVAIIITPIIIDLAMNDSMSDLSQGLTIASVAVLGVIVLSVLSNLGLIVWATSKNFVLAINPIAVLKLTHNYLGALIGILVFTFILNSILFFGGLAIVSPFFLFWGAAVQAHLFGQVARECFSESAPIANAVAAE
ncbi:MAG: DUF4013 domain-containing protein [Calditrichaeota bacterium]|nr:MAG: DUF4013 domain-containing protein [Calditrichota bacterium]